MSYLTRLALRFGPVVLLAIVILSGAGTYAATQIQQDLVPNVSVPTFEVVVADPGASPTVVDQEVTLPVVNSLQGVSGVDTVSSTSSSGASLVTVTFKDGTDTTADRQSLSTALDSVRSTLPQGAQAPTITPFSTSATPILVYAVSANEPLGDLAGQLRTTALPKLKGLAGVSSVSLSGAPTQEVQVVLDPAKLAAHGLTTSAVATALQQATLVQSVGSVKEGAATIPIQISGSLTSLDQIQGVLVTAPVTQNSGGSQGASGATTAGAGTSQGAPSVAKATTASNSATPAVPIGQLGSVQQVSVPADSITRTNGKLSIGLSVLKAPDANTVTVANEVKTALPDLRSRVGHGVSFQAISDQAVPVTSAISDIVREGLLGAAFAIVVIFIFLRSFRATLVAAVSIPLSLLVALLVLWLTSITLNVLTLGAMVVAIGRVVDDAIVVLENISRHISEGESPLAATYSASREILTAVTSSTVTTIAVFLPIAFLSGIAGSFFRPFALTVVVALIASLGVAVMVVPLLASRLLPGPKLRALRSPRSLSPLQRVYVPIIRWATSHRLVTLAAAGVFFLGSMALVPQLRINLFDQSTSPSFPVNITMAENSTLEQTNLQTEAVERSLQGVSGISAYQATVGGASDTFGPGSAGGPADPTRAQVLVVVNNGAYNQALQGVKNALHNYSGPARVSVGQGQGGASSNQMQVDVHAPDQAALDQANGAVLAALGKVPGLTDVRSNLAASKPQYQLVPTTRLSQSGLSLQQLGGLVAQQLNGQVATQAALPSGQMDVRVQLPPGTADTASGIASMQVQTASGLQPLSSLATLQKVAGPQSVSRVNGDRSASITGTITGNNTTAVQNAVNSALAKVSLPSGASTSTGGVFSQLSSVLTQFIVAIAAAIGLVYIVLVATFRSLLKPLVLLVAIPFAATGAIIALVITGTALSLPAMIGLLMLVGIVVTNAIVLIDLVEQYRDQGLPVQQALIEGGRHRLRPILMTASATMLALSPLALSGNGGGGFISAPLAIVVIGGLFTSTVLTLVLVPVLYSMLSRFTAPKTSRNLEDELDSPPGRPSVVAG